MRKILAAGALAGTMLFTSAALAAEAPKISVELNDLQQGDTGCQAVFVLNNGLGKALDKFAFSVVAFDGKGHATVFLSFDFGSIPVGKTRISRFGLGDKVVCSDVSRLVLDDVKTCSGAGVGPGDCLAAIGLSTRAAVPFDF
ncbi:MAG: hypothetical protein ABI399_04090 [Bauldia sp.]